MSDSVEVYSSSEGTPENIEAFVKELAEAVTTIAEKHGLYPIHGGVSVDGDVNAVMRFTAQFVISANEGLAEAGRGMVEMIRPALENAPQYHRIDGEDEEVSDAEATEAAESFDYFKKLLSDN